MSQLRYSPINRRQWVVSSMIGGVAILTNGHILHADSGSSQRLVPLSQYGESTLPILRRVAENMAQSWKFDTGESASDSGWVDSPPVVENGVVYFGSRNGNFYAVNIDNGEEIWHFSTGNSLNTSPMIVDGVAYIGSNDGNLYALDISDGSELWRLSTGSGISYSPTVVDGTVYFGNADVTLFVVNSTDGSILWQLAPGYGSTSSPVVVDGVVSFSGAFFNGWDAASGTKLWELPTGPEKLVAGDGIVFAGSNVGTVYALDPQTGSEIWQTSPSWSSKLIAATSTLVYIADASDLYAVDVASGIERWRFESSSNYGIVSVVEEAGVVHVGLEYEGLVALDIDDGSELWHFDDEDMNLNFSTLTVANGVAYIGDMGNGSLYALILPGAIG